LAFAKSKARALLSSSRFKYLEQPYSGT